MNDEFVEKTKRVIQDRAGSRCSNPECRALTSGPNAHPERSTKTGVAAHISAASPGGSRYNPNLTRAQRKSAENGIWLCQNCAHFIDTDYLNYSIELLYDWKCQSEKEADDEIKGRLGRLTSLSLVVPEEEQQQGWGCPFCGTVVELGKSVCLGCQAEVVPGLTRFERQETANMGIVLGGCVAFLLLVVLPGWLKSSQGWNVDSFWGLGVYSVVIAGLLVLACGISIIHFAEQKKLQQPPRFFRNSIK